MKKFPLVKSFLLTLGLAIGCLSHEGTAYAQPTKPEEQSTAPKVAAAGATPVPSVAHSVPAELAEAADSARAAPPAPFERSSNSGMNPNR